MIILVLNHILKTMINNLEHYIVKNIQSFYKQRIISPILYLIFILILTFAMPVTQMAAPTKVNSTEAGFSLEKLQKDKTEYININLSNLYFTGYTKEWIFGTEGYYYYTMVNDQCIFLLLSPKTCEQGIPYIENIDVPAKITYNSRALDLLLDSLAVDLNWDADGIHSTVSKHMLSEPAATDLRTRLFLFVYGFTGLFAICNIIIYIMYILFPAYSYPIQKLRAYGNPKKILAQAEEELATLPQLATEDMFITEHYFIETSKYGIAIVPIDQIIWIYKYSTLHKFMWHHFSISYTLHIAATNRHYIKCPKNVKSDIDGIMDYLAEANHNILVGFNEENRLKVEEIQDDFKPLRVILSFLSKKV